MDIRGDSKRIVQMLLNVAVEQGDFRIDFQIDFPKIAQELRLESENYCRICFLYLANKGIITPYKEAGCIQIIPAAAVDFIAET